MTTAAPRASRSFLSPAAAPAIIVVGAGILLSGVWSDAAPQVFFDEGIRVGGVLLAMAGYGAWPTAWLLRRAIGGAQAYLLATALGAGLLGILILLLGGVGFLGSAIAWSLVFLGIVFGLAKILAAGVDATRAANDDAGRDSIPLRRVGLELLALAVLAFPLSIAIFSATLPPGLLWPEEGNGYDVLEYHLQAPREYYESGRIQILPHNVYAQFPQQIEIFYLLLMHLRGGAHEAALACQLLHLAFGVLAVVAVGAWLPAGPSRWVGVLAAGGVPWLSYLGCLAYNELGVLYFATLSIALMMRAIAEPDAATHRRWLLVAGLLAGLATGAKLTAAGMVVAPLAIAWLLTARAAIGARVVGAAVFSVAALAAFSPWLARSYAFTGNPVYPFAYELFGGRAWSAEQAQQWKRGHALPVVDQPPAKRLSLAWRETVASSLFGPGLFALALLGIVLQRDREAWFILLLLITAMTAWILMTHMPGRFVVPLIGGLALAAGRAAACTSRAAIGRAAVLSLLGVASAAAGAAHVFHRLTDAAENYRKLTNVPLVSMVDHVDFMLEFAQPLNHVSEDENTKLWLVGEAAAYYITTPHRYTVVFNGDEWVDFARTATPAAAIEWLRSKGYSHLVFCWPEIERLAGTYGFPSHVTRSWVGELISAGLERVGPVGDSAEQAAPTRYEIFRIPQAPAARGAGSP